MCILPALLRLQVWHSNTYFLHIMYALTSNALVKLFVYPFRKGLHEILMFRWYRIEQPPLKDLFLTITMCGHITVCWLPSYRPITARKCQYPLTTPLPVNNTHIILHNNQLLKTPHMTFVVPLFCSFAHHWPLTSRKIVESSNYRQRWTEHSMVSTNHTHKNCSFKEPVQMTCTDA